MEPFVCTLTGRDFGLADLALPELGCYGLSAGPDKRDDYVTVGLSAVPDRCPLWRTIRHGCDTPYSLRFFRLVWCSRITGVKNGVAITLPGARVSRDGSRSRYAPVGSSYPVNV